MDLLEKSGETYLPARFIDRYKRFTVEAIVTEGERAGERVFAHLADPGRLVDVLVPEATLYLSGPYPPPRSLAWSVRLAAIPATRDDDGERVLVSLDSTLANRVVPTLVERGLLPELPPARHMRREVRVGSHRFDLAWDLPGGMHICEIKTVTHRLPSGEGAWPDAPSERGRRHLAHLIELASAGSPTSLVFVAGRPDIEEVVANRAVDPAFAELLAEAAGAGVRLLGVRLRPTLEGPRYLGPLAVRAHG